MSLEPALRDLLPTDCGLAVGPIGDPPPSPFDGEEQIVACAVAKRRREFRAGRQAARRALAQLGAPPCPIGAHPSGDPIWPPGFIGSITHTDETVAAVVARSATLGGLGLDLEPDTALDADLAPLICRPEEMTRADLAKLRFVAKEAYFKAVFPSARALFDFQDVRVHIDPAGAWLAFEAVNPAASAPRQGEVIGRYARSAGHIVAVAWFAAQHIGNQSAVGLQMQPGPLWPSTAGKRP